MDPTRVNTTELTATLGTASKKLDEALELLRPTMPMLTKEQRKRLLRPPEDFPERAGEMMAALKGHPQVTEVCGFAEDAVREDLANVDALVGIGAKANEVKQLIDDARLVWLSEAYEPALAAYRVAGALNRKDAKLRTVVEALAPLFERPARKKPQ